MKLYADIGARRVRQLGFDVLTLAWIVVWIWLGIVAHQRISDSAAGARKVENGGQKISRNLHDTAEVLSHTPIVGGRVRTPLDHAAEAGAQLQHAGEQIGDNLGRVGAAIGVEIALAPVLVALLAWGVLRVGYARRAARAASVADLPGGADLLALNALSRVRGSALVEIGPDVLNDWRGGDREVTDALARAYLRSLGLRGARLRDH